MKTTAESADGFADLKDTMMFPYKNHESKYSFFTTAELKPAGWLRRQLEIQAAGLSGNLDKVWPDVRDSAWIGGDREGWERVPYWLDGFIPLAYLLDDADRIARAKRYMDAIMDAQADDGWICPCKRGERGGYDLWAALLMCKVLALYADCSGDGRAVESLRRALANLNGFLNGCTLRNWGAARWFEGIIPALWLYERTREDWLIELCWKLRAQGFNWESIVDSPIWEMRTKGWDFLTHVVNIAMMLKCGALTARLDGSDPDAFARRALAKLLRENGMATHHFTGDECLAGTSPIHGSELCSVVEAMYSYEQIFAVSGSPEWLDQLERLAFNALPAALSPDMWTHQYDQLTNQTAAIQMPADFYRCNAGDANMFGLEPQYGCCTANFNQGFPKFALSTFMRSEHGIASCALAPARLETHIGEAKVSVTLDTAYPFRGDLTYTVATDRAVRFTLSLRIPSFACTATIDGVSATPGTMHEIDREWTGVSTVRVKLAFEPVFEERPNGMLALWRGPLLYALPIGERSERLEYERNGVERKFPYCDYALYPATDWNYGFASDAAAVNVAESPLDVPYPFSPDGAPVSLEVPMAKIPWRTENGLCAARPDSAEAQGPVEVKRLVPYGCTNLRLTETVRVNI